MKRIKHRGSVDTKELARLIQEGKWTRALRIAERIRSHPDLPDWFHSSRGLILQKLGKARAALHAYEEALVRDPSLGTRNLIVRSSYSNAGFMDLRSRD